MGAQAMMSVYPPGFVLLAGHKSHIEEAKQYCIENKLSGDDVKITINPDGDLFVKTKKEIKFGRE